MRQDPQSIIERTWETKKNLTKMSKWKETSITYAKCVNKIHGVQKDYCSHFLAGGKEGTPEAFFCRSCHLCFHEKEVEKVLVDTLYFNWLIICDHNHKQWLILVFVWFRTNQTWRSSTLVVVGYVWETSCHIYEK